MDEAFVVKVLETLLLIPLERFQHDPPNVGRVASIRVCKVAIQSTEQGAGLICSQGLDETVHLLESAIGSQE